MAEPNSGELKRSINKESRKSICSIWSCGSNIPGTEKLKRDGRNDKTKCFRFVEATINYFKAGINDLDPLYQGQQ